MGEQQADTREIVHDAEKDAAAAQARSSKAAASAVHRTNAEVGEEAGRISAGGVSISSLASSSAGGGEAPPAAQSLGILKDVNARHVVPRAGLVEVAEQLVPAGVNAEKLVDCIRQHFTLEGSVRYNELLVLMWACVALGAKLTIVSGLDVLYGPGETSGRVIIVSTTATDMVVLTVKVNYQSWVVPTGSHIEFTTEAPADTSDAIRLCTLKVEQDGTSRTMAQQNYHFWSDWLHEMSTRIEVDVWQVVPIW